MEKCKNCEYGINKPLPNEQIGHEGKFIDNWECNHPDDVIKKKSIQKGWVENCPEFIAK